MIRTVFRSIAKLAADLASTFQERSERDQPDGYPSLNEDGHWVGPVAGTVNTLTYFKNVANVSPLAGDIGVTSDALLPQMYVARIEGGPYFSTHSRNVLLIKSSGEAIPFVASADTDAARGVALAAAVAAHAAGETIVLTDGAIYEPADNLTFDEDVTLVGNATIKPAATKTVLLSTINFVARGVTFNIAEGKAGLTADAAAYPFLDLVDVKFASAFTDSIGIDLNAGGHSGGTIRNCRSTTGTGIKGGSYSGPGSLLFLVGNEFRCSTNCLFDPVDTDNSRYHATGNIFHGPDAIDICPTEAIFISNRITSDSGTFAVRVRQNSATFTNNHIRCLGDVGVYAAGLAGAGTITVNGGSVYGTTYDFYLEDDQLVVANGVNYAAAKVDGVTANFSKGEGNFAALNCAAITADGNISILGTGIASGNRNISFGTNYGNPAIILYQGGGASSWGWGLNGGEMQFYAHTSVGNHFSWNGGGALQTPGTNELMRLETSDGKLTVSGNVEADNHLTEIVAVMDDGGTVLALGDVGMGRPIALDGEIVGWHLHSDVAGTLTLDVKVDGVSIINVGNFPELAADDESSGTPNTWATTSLVEGDRLTIEILDSATITSAVLVLKVKRT